MIFPVFQPRVTYQAKDLSFGYLDARYAHLPAVPLLKLCPLADGVLALGDLTVLNHSVLPIAGGKLAPGIS